VLWLSAVSVPLGGLLADRTGRHGTIMLLCFLVTALLMIVAIRTDAVVVTVVLLGALSGLAAGPIMSLPARVLAPDTRALGMGIYFSVSYVGLVVGPALGGRYATWAGSAAATFDLGAAMLLICPLMLWLFHRIQAVATKPVQATA
jgi:predicted MFS family arabinose efflux permease